MEDFIASEVYNKFMKKQSKRGQKGNNSEDFNLPSRDI